MVMYFPKWISYGPRYPQHSGKWLMLAVLTASRMLGLQLDLGLNVGGKSKGAERGWGGNWESREFPSKLFKSRNPFYLCRWLWFARIKIKGITVGRAMTNARLGLLKPSISPSLRLPSRLQVGASAMPGWVNSQCAPSWQGRGVQALLYPLREVHSQGQPGEASCSYSSNQKSSFRGKTGGKGSGTGSKHGAGWLTEMQLLVKSNCLELYIFPYPPWWHWKAASKLC